ncbi:aldehyde dehydrogenase [Choiromyces venosus 120613-1]|uniref:Aldehyde dehydrogenase n=1 Tax=Choiromyces venosus 120613-1 TaxID=1336337 RepID=A0A3N4JS80_9PEZI|nr:aldehyde dehydrogenase [Choiromyces venosus 120613-1]
MAEVRSTLPPRSPQDIRHLYVPVHEIADKVHALRETFKTQKTFPISFRKEQLRRLYYVLEDHADEFADAMYHDMGKPRKDSLMELGNCLTEICHTVENMEHWLADQEVKSDPRFSMASTRIKRKPLGVALIITAFNAPLTTAVWPLSGAIAGGNCFVLKPAENSPGVAALWTKYLFENLDNSFHTVVNGEIPETTELLNQKFDQISYTGSTAVGRIIATAAAKNLTPCVLELGGKNPVFIDRNVDLDDAARKIAWGRTMSAGQACLCPDYIIVHPDQTADLIAKVEHHWSQFWSKPLINDPKYGRIVHKRAYDRITSLLGPSRIPAEASEVDLFIPPMILRVEKNDPLMSQEIFGPIVCVLEYSSVEDAISFVNSGDRPLAVYPFSQNSKWAEMILQKTLAGTSTVNDLMMSVWPAGFEFGGAGESGYGKFKGKASLYNFTSAMTILEMPKWMDYLTGVRFPNATPLDDWLAEMGKAKPKFSREVGSAEKVGKESIVSTNGMLACAVAAIVVAKFLHKGGDFSDIGRWVGGILNVTAGL